jgi:hypothetical protein
MTTWWSFSTHIFSQFFTLLLVTGTMVLWANLKLRVTSDEVRVTKYGLHKGFILHTSSIILLLTLVFLGHFGFFINTALLFGGALALTWLAHWRGAGWARRLRWPLSLAYAGALLFALAFFYSAYVPIFLEQARVAADGGLSAVAQRAPVTRAMLWAGLWEAGLVQHFGFFPLLLALGSLWLLPRWKPHDDNLPANRWLLFWLMLGTFGVSATFATVPFITLATNSTRWLMFSAWAVAVGAALVTHWLWQRGRAGRLVVLLMGGYMLWLTALTWLGPMLWRIRPPEPF